MSVALVAKKWACQNGAAVEITWGLWRAQWKWEFSYAVQAWPGRGFKAPQSRSILSSTLPPTEGPTFKVPRARSAARACDVLQLLGRIQLARLQPQGIKTIFGGVLPHIHRHTIWWDRTWILLHSIASIIYRCKTRGINGAEWSALVLY